MPQIEYSSGYEDRIYPITPDVMALIAHHEQNQLLQGMVGMPGVDPAIGIDHWEQPADHLAAALQGFRPAIDTYLGLQKALIPHHLHDFTDGVTIAGQTAMALAEQARLIIGPAQVEQALPTAEDISALPAQDYFKFVAHYYGDELPREAPGAMYDSGTGKLTGFVDVFPTFGYDPRLHALGQGFHEAAHQLLLFGSGATQFPDRNQQPNNPVTHSGYAGIYRVNMMPEGIYSEAGELVDEAFAEHMAGSLWDNSRETTPGAYPLQPSYQAYTNRLSLLAQHAPATYQVLVSLLGPDAPKDPEQLCNTRDALEPVVQWIES